jgi:hypothetical protein
METIKPEVHGNCKMAVQQMYSDYSFDFEAAFERIPHLVRSYYIPTVVYSHKIQLNPSADERNSFDC